VSFKSFLSATGHDFVGILKFLGSTQGQTVVSGAEVAAAAIGSAVNPALGASILGVESLVNAGLKSALSIEASAAAVGAQSGTGTQKLAAVTASLSGQAGSFLQSIGVSSPTDEEVQTLATAIGNASAAVLNAIPAPVPATTAEPAAPAA
jgi:hypothetical protein